MTFASNAALRERMFLAYNTRAYPANGQILLDLLATRQEIADVLGFRSWADLATADQMMGTAADVRVFLAKLDEASLDGARREHEMILQFVRDRQPELKDIDITSRGYWYEQFRRSAFDFDSQSVRPYFPYAKVEAGVLKTAAQLFQNRVPSLDGVSMASCGFSLRSFRPRQECGPLLSGHAPARGQGQVVLRRAGGDGRARTRSARGRAHLQLSWHRRGRSWIAAIQRCGDVSSMSSAT